MDQWVPSLIFNSSSIRPIRDYLNMFRTAMFTAFRLWLVIWNIILTVSYENAIACKLCQCFTFNCSWSRLKCAAYICINARFYNNSACVCCILLKRNCLTYRSFCSLRVSTRGARNVVTGLTGQSSCVWKIRNRTLLTLSFNGATSRSWLMADSVIYIAHLTCKPISFCYCLHEGSILEREHATAVECRQLITSDASTNTRKRRDHQWRVNFVRIFAT